jgi:hypothetical protein
VVSVGGRDRAICQWAVKANIKDPQEAPEKQLELAVLTPPPKRIVEMPVAEFTAAKETLAPVKEGPLDTPLRHATASLMLLQICVVTSDVKCGHSKACSALL